LATASVYGVVACCDDARPMLELAGQPLLGRARELDLLVSFLDGIETIGQALMLRGAPGIGKSRLLAERRRRRRDGVPARRDHEGHPRRRSRVIVGSTVVCPSQFDAPGRETVGIDALERYRHSCTSTVSTLVRFALARRSTGNRCLSDSWKLLCSERVRGGSERVHR
jgi:hypothetical protein